jgi:hypothetical protein
LQQLREKDGWIEVEPGDGPALERWGFGVYAPGCGNCLRIISKKLHGVAPGERIIVPLALVADGQVS